MMARARQLALILGLAMLVSFITVMTVHYLLPVDPLNPEPVINYRALFAIVFVVMCGALGVSHAVARRET
ncbi:MAG: hypothetical protein J4G19_08135 [Pseudomonadales bacterium]|nr:hypothetical protein [Pseudomonadales bacterium]